MPGLTELNSWGLKRPAIASTLLQIKPPNQTDQGGTGPTVDLFYVLDFFYVW